MYRTGALSGNNSLLHIYHMNMISDIMEKKRQISSKSAFLNAPVLRRYDGLMIYENPGECMHAPNAPSNHLALLSLAMKFVTTTS